ncbi:MAG: tetratricopeptide repeat protein [Alphaproteobacteria bacterium]|nr:tetratricopeptide repeat protein [Alphaproteobacteria bacterium]MDD9919567.1 tetratricopeptide repeat protein [Alphaproteobacteria bacterium]
MNFKLSFSVFCLAIASCSSVDSQRIHKDKAYESQASFGEVVSSYLKARVAEQDTLETTASTYLSALAVQPDTRFLRHKAYAYALATGNMPTAVRLAKTFTRAEDPGSIAWVLLAANALKERQYQDALTYISWAQKITPQLLHFQVMRNQIELEQGRSISNISTELLNFEGHDFLESRKYYHLARMQYRAGAANQAFKNLQKAQNLEPGALFTVLALGEALEQKGDIEQAQSIYDSFAHKNPDALLLQHVYKRLSENKPTPNKKQASLSQDVSEVIFGFSMLMWSQQLDMPARQLLQIALWLDNNPLYRFYAGMMDEQADRLAKAINQYNNIPAGGVAGLAAQVRAVEAMFNSGSPEKAIEHLIQVKKDYPQLVALDQLLAEMYYQQEQYADSIIYYNTVFSKLENPYSREYVPLYFARGASYERLRQWEKAELDLEQALKLDPDNPSLLNYLGYMWLDADMNLDKAFAYISKAALLKPSDGAVIDSLGWAYFKKGEYTRALLYLERAAELIPTDATVMEHLGDVHSKLGNSEKAQQYWEKAWSLEPAGQFEQARLAKKLGISLD